MRNACADATDAPISVFYIVLYYFLFSLFNFLNILQSHLSLVQRFYGPLFDLHLSAKIASHDLANRARELDKILL